MKITESKIEAKVVAYCRKRGLLTYKFSSPSQRGVPDRIIIGGGRVLFLELKRPGNIPTALQMYELVRIRVHGGGAEWAQSYESAVWVIDEYFRLGATNFI